MGSLEAREAFTRSVRHLLRLHALSPQALAADMHPGYVTTRWAAEQAAALGVPLITVQHHHAHLAALLAERGRVGSPALGVVLDGTGLGCDRHVWGGELLRVGEDVGVAERLGHLEEFPLPGGDIAVRQPFRVALALLHHAGVEPGRWRPPGVAEALVRLVRSQLGTGSGCVPTSSVGRLFDGVSSLLGIRQEITYEAQAAVELEACAAGADAAHPLRLPVQGTRLLVGPLIHDVVGALERRTPVPRIALGFHLALARAAAALAVSAARATGTPTVGLSGGVFANRILLRELTACLDRAGLEVLTHARVPANDGGLALGQAVVARARLAATAAEAC
jgi:hydrogenase maturation protein HypF